jgi:hypothetical protein
MPRVRLEISIAYTDKKGVKRYANRLGNLWLDTDTMKGSIDLPPGVSIVGGGDHYINVQPPFEKEGAGSSAGGGQHRERAAGAQYPEDDSNIPF